MSIQLNRPGFSLFSPESPGEKDKYGEYFQASDQHQQCQQDFGEIVKVGETSHRPYASEAGPYVAHAGNDRTTGGSDVFREKRHNDASDAEHDHKEDKETHYVGHDVGVYALVVVFDIDDPVRVDDPFQFDKGVFEKQEYADYLNATGR